MQAKLIFPDISPELFSITLFGFDFALRWYALAYIVGILVAWRLGVMAVKRSALWYKDTPPATPVQIEDLLTWIILGIILGGRFGFMLFYQPGYYLENPVAILKIWEGGMSFHGGLLGVVIASWGYAWRHNICKRTLADLIAHTVPCGLLLGRLANFTNAELWGRASDVPWAVVFPGNYAQDCPDVVGLCARHPSQLYEAALEGLVLGVLLLWLVYRRNGLRFPGMITGVFLAGYGIARFVVEFVRQPDAQFISLGNPLGLAFQIDGYGLTMGQLLSLPMIALGIWLIVTARAIAAGDKSTA